MTTAGIVTMVVICGLVWGGFAFLLIRAVRSESRKPADDAADRIDHGKG